MTDDSRDRIIALEVKVLHLIQTVEGLVREQRDTRDLIQQAKGARWLGNGIWLGIGGSMSIVAYKLLALIGLKIGS